MSDLERGNRFHGVDREAWSTFFSYVHTEDETLNLFLRNRLRLLGDISPQTLNQLISVAIDRERGSASLAIHVPDPQQNEDERQLLHVLSLGLERGTPDDAIKHLSALVEEMSTRDHAHELEVVVRITLAELKRIKTVNEPQEVKPQRDATLNDAEETREQRHGRLRREAGKIRTPVASLRREPQTARVSPATGQPEREQQFRASGEDARHVGRSSEARSAEQRVVERPAAEERGAGRRPEPATSWERRPLQRHEQAKGNPSIVNKISRFTRQVVKDAWNYKGTTALVGATTFASSVVLAAIAFPESAIINGVLDYVQYDLGWGWKGALVIPASLGLTTGTLSAHIQGRLQRWSDAKWQRQQD